MIMLYPPELRRHVAPTGLEPATGNHHAPARAGSKPDAIPRKAGITPAQSALRGDESQAETVFFFQHSVYFQKMISSAQIRAARGLLKWTQAMLAHRAAISIVTLNMIESDRVDPRASTLRAIATALEKAGVDFIGSEREGLGVRLCPRRRR